MKHANVLLALATGLSLLFAGCGSKPEAKVDPTPNIDPVVTDELGSIVGSVESDDLLPVEGAQVLLSPSQKTAVTGDDGRFVFNLLAPDSYSVVVSALGFDTAQARVEVAAGQVAEKQFILTPIALDEPHHESIPFAGRFDCSAALVGVLWQDCSVTSQGGDMDAQFYFDKPEGVDYIVAEIQWTQASAGTGQNLDFNLVGPEGHDASQWYANVFGPAPLKIIVKVGQMYDDPTRDGEVGASENELGEPLDQVVDDEDVRLGLDIYSSPVYTDAAESATGEKTALVGVTFQQNFQGFVTFYYDEAPEEGFTAFSDG